MHVAIQDAFGWTDSHLHAFRIGRSNNSLIGIPGPDGDDFIKTIPGWEVKVKSKFTESEQKVIYEYDSGDGWEHEVKFEKLIDEEIKRPRCIDGARACPPEDCGGPGGYEDFCAIMKKKKGSEYKEMKEWFGGDYNPEEFNVDEVRFDNPKERLKILYS